MKIWLLPLFILILIPLPHTINAAIPNPIDANTSNSCLNSLVLSCSVTLSTKFTNEVLFISGVWNATAGVVTTNDKQGLFLNPVNRQATAAVGGCIGTTSGTESCEISEWATNTTGILTNDVVFLNNTVAGIMALQVFSAFDYRYPNGGGLLFDIGQNNNGNGAVSTPSLTIQTNNPNDIIIESGGFATSETTGVGLDGCSFLGSTVPQIASNGFFESSQYCLSQTGKTTLQWQTQTKWEAWIDSIILPNRGGVGGGGGGGTGIPVTLPLTNTTITIPKILLDPGTLLVFGIVSGVILLSAIPTLRKREKSSRRSRIR